MTVFVISSVLCVLCVLLLGKYYWSSRRLRSLARLLPGPTTVPLLGNADLFVNTSTFKTLIQQIDEHGPICRMWIAWKLLVLIADADDARSILGNSENLSRDQFMMSVIRPFTGNGLLASQGNVWKIHRRLTHPAFHSKILEQFVDVFHRNSEILIESLTKYADGSTFDVFPHVGECSLAITHETAVGTPINDTKQCDLVYRESFKEVLKIIENRIAKPWLLVNSIFSFTTSARKEREVIKILDGHTEHEITRKLLLHKNHGTEDSKPTYPVSVLDVLLNMSGVESSVITRQFLRDLTNTLLLAGQESIATGVSFALILLGLHQDVQDGVIKEQERIFHRGPGQPVTAKELKEMKYLSEVVKETFRLFPPIPLITRELSKDVNIKGYTLPKGCTAVIINYNVHRSTKYFSDPESFSPERFSPEKCENQHPYAFIPFGKGPRQCLGKEYAMMQIKAILSSIIRKYKVLPAYGKECLNDLEMGMVLRPKKGFQLKLLPRERL